MARARPTAFAKTERDRSRIVLISRAPLGQIELDHLKSLCGLDALELFTWAKPSRVAADLLPVPEWVLGRPVIFLGKGAAASVGIGPWVSHAWREQLIRRNPNWPVLGAVAYAPAYLHRTPPAHRKWWRQAAEHVRYARLQAQSVRVAS